MGTKLLLKLSSQIAEGRLSNELKANLLDSVSNAWNSDSCSAKSECTKKRQEQNKPERGSHLVCIGLARESDSQLGGSQPIRDNRGIVFNTEGEK